MFDHEKQYTTDTVESTSKNKNKFSRSNKSANKFIKVSETSPHDSLKAVTNEA